MSASTEACDYYATVATVSMTNKAKQELRKELNVSKHKIKKVMGGKLKFTTSVDPKFLFNLRSVERVGVLLYHSEWKTETTSAESAEQNLQIPHTVDKLLAILEQTKWSLGARVWCNFNSIAESEKKTFSYKVLTKRAGNILKQCTTNDISREIGKHIGRKMDAWDVHLTNPDLEILVQVSENGILVGIDLAKHTSLDNVDNRKVAGLDPVVSWGLVRTANISSFDVILDPMCGRGILLLEAFRICPHTILIGADKDWQMLEKAKANLLHSKRSLNLDYQLLYSDATDLALRSNSVDVIVCDLPFGKQFGSVEENKNLYPKVLDEAMRVIKLETGRAVLLTNVDNEDTLDKYLSKQYFWQLIQKRSLLLGRMKSCIYVLATENARKLFSFSQGGDNKKENQNPIKDHFAWERDGTHRWNKQRRLERSGLQSTHKRT